MASETSGGAAVRLRDWGWRHGTRSAWAAAGVDLDIAPGERVLLLGASGSGKSTLAHGLAGVLGGDDEGDERGSLLVDGVDPRSARGRVGLVLQDPDSQVILARVGDDVAFGCENLGVPRDEIWPRVDDALDAVGLRLPREHPTAMLSGGQKQRLALAGVVAMRPGLIVLDEPTANLDPAGVTEVRDAVTRVAAATSATLVVIEHRVEAWIPVVDRVIVLGGGRVVADGTPDAVLAREGESLAAAGVWIPGRTPALAPHRRPSVHPTLLVADGLAVARTRGTPVAEQVALEVRAGRAIAVTGPNGSGKSTLALTMAGLLRPEDGRLMATDALAAGAGPEPIRWRSRQLVSRIGMVFQEPEYQFVTGSVRAELAAGPRAVRLGAAETRSRLDELLVRLRLDGLADANPFTLSGGEKRRLSVATVLATRPAVLVLDEPTFGQDARTWAELVDMLDGLVDDGVGLLAVSHDAHFVDAVADVRFALGAGVAGALVGAHSPDASAAPASPDASASAEVAR